MQNLWTVTQYQAAYYGAVSAVERAELGLRYRSPWFVWSGWFLWTTGYGPLSDYTPELLSGVQQWFWWTIQSRTTSIPNIGMGNTDPMLSDISSKNYNQIWYVNLETFLLSYDDTPSSDVYAISLLPLVYFTGGGITGVFRLPPKVFSGFWLWTDPSSTLCRLDGYLNDCTSDGDPDGDWTYDDIALSWSLEWLYNWNGFKIFPTIAVFQYSWMRIDYPNDNAIRESVINNTGTIDFNKFTLLMSNGVGLHKHTVVGSDASAIETWTFNEILSLSNFSGLRVSFGAANLFRTRIGSIYPYLEYQFTFPQSIADRFYTIEWHGRVGEYDVKILLKKPTVQGTVGGDFTLIF